MVGLWCLTPLSTHFSHIVAFSFICGGNRSTWRKPPTCTCHKSLTNFITSCSNEYISSWTGLELTNLVLICTDCTDIWKSNYHTITTTMNIYIYIYLETGRNATLWCAFLACFAAITTDDFLFSTTMYIYCVYIVILKIHNKCQLVWIEQKQASL